MCLPVDAVQLCNGVGAFWMLWWVLVDFLDDKILGCVFEPSFYPISRCKIAAHAKVFFKRRRCRCHSKDKKKNKKGSYRALCTALFEVFVKVFEFCLKLCDCFFECIVRVAFAHTDV